MKKVGGFPDLRAAEDRIFMERVRDLSFKIAYTPDAKVFWRIEPTLIKTYKRFREYSRWDLKAGRARDWHLPVARLYLVGIILLSLGWLVNPVWWWILLAGVLARAAEKFLRRRKSETATFGIHKFLTVLSLIGALDFAMFAGSVDFFLKDMLKVKG